MGKGRGRWVQRCLGVLLFWLVLGTYAQAAIFTVNSPSDANGAAPLDDGICATAYTNGVPNGVCTLRAAIQEANALSGTDQIILPALQAPNAYVLTLTAELLITGNLTITGGGASTTIIDGNKAVRPDSGVLTISSGVSISGVTIRNGGRTGINFSLMGGGIHNGGAVTLINSTVSGNSAQNGGGIRTQGGGSTVTLINSTVSGNSADSGGGIAFFFGTLRLANSTVSDNSAGGNGGGIYNNLGANLGTVTLINSTVSGNDAGEGGGIYTAGTANTVSLFSATITDNIAFFGSGGGVFRSSGAFNFQNTILAGNFKFVPGPPFTSPADCAGTINSNGNNLMGVVDGCNLAGADVLLSADPKLGELQNNGGPTLTHALLPGSPAINAGNILGCRDNLGALLVKDQRGFRRTAGNRCDIGAVEFGSGPFVTVRADADFDGDGKADIAVYREGVWFIRSSDGGTAATGWGGLPQDVPVPADYDGDGKADLAVYRNGIWFIRRSFDGGTTTVGWGGVTQDVPVPADYDGDGRTDLAVYRDGIWFILASSGGVITTGWGGLTQDIPVPADYDGDGKADIAVYRDGVWFIRRSSDAGTTVVSWGGLTQDIAVPADYDGDGKADLAVYRDGVWFILRYSDGGVTTPSWGGLYQDLAVPGDYDGDNKTDLAVYRDGVWFVLRSYDGGVTTTSWGGLTQDIPLN